MTLERGQHVFIDRAPHHMKLSSRHKKTAAPFDPQPRFPAKELSKSVDLFRVISATSSTVTIDIDGTVSIDSVTMDPRGKASAPKKGRQRLQRTRDLRRSSWNVRTGRRTNQKSRLRLDNTLLTKLSRTKTRPRDAAIRVRWYVYTAKEDTL